MKKIHHLWFFVLLLLLIVACSKEGPKGDSGAQGQQGIIGPAGPKGADGTAGSVIYSGTTIPTATTGNIGDFYLNTTTGLLYGPKTAAGWGAGFLLKGTNGTAGSQTFSGNGAPAASLGANNDYYLDRSNYLLYGPKTGGSWGAPINLRGPQGPPGSDGNANVKATIFTVSASDWGFAIFSEANQFYPADYYIYNEPSITADLLNNGLVLVYFQATPAFPDGWVPLPYTYFSTAGYALHWDFRTRIGQVTVIYHAIKINTDPPPSVSNPPAERFKLILITGDLSNAIKTTNIDLGDYDAVSRYTGAWQQDKLNTKL